MDLIKRDNKNEIDDTPILLNKISSLYIITVLHILNRDKIKFPCNTKEETHEFLSQSGTNIHKKLDLEFTCYKKFPLFPTLHEITYKIFYEMKNDLIINSIKENEKNIIILSLKDGQQHFSFSSIFRNF